MGKIDNFSQSINWSYSPAFKTITISTKRSAAKANGKVAAPVAKLSGVESSPLVLPSQDSRQAIIKAIGTMVTDATSIQIWQLFIKKCSHLDGVATVNALPDINVGDLVTIAGVDYGVRWADITHPFMFGNVLILWVTEDKA